MDEATDANVRAAEAQARLCYLPGVLDLLYLGQALHCIRDALHAHDWAHYGLAQLGDVISAEKQACTGAKRCFFFGLSVINVLTGFPDRCIQCITCWKLAGQKI
jgi:hypothetical protein